MKNYADFISGMTNIKCMAIEDEACASVDGFSKPNSEIMKEIEAEEKAREREEQKNAAKIQLQKDSYHPCFTSGKCVCGGQLCRAACRMAGSYRRSESRYR